MEKSQNTSLYFAFIIFSMLFQCRQLTLWGFYHDLTPIFRWSATLLAIPVFVSSIQKYEGKDSLVVLVIGYLVLLAGYNSENITMLLLSFVMVVGAKEIMFRDIIKVHFIFALCFCTFNILGRVLDLIPKTFLIRGNEREGLFGEVVAREDFGYGFPTDFALHVFYILLDYWILKNRRLKWGEILIYFCLAYFIIIFSDARLAAFCILLIAILSLVLPYLQNKSFINVYLINPLFIISIPLFALISIVGTIMYDETDIYWIGADVLFSGRLQLGQDAIKEAGISLFGQTYTMYGMGNLGAGDDYNYIDCSYLQSLVFWGVVLSIILVLLFVRICKFALSRMDYVLLSAIFIAGISGVIAQFFYFFAYCPLLIAVTARNLDYDTNEMETDSTSLNELEE